MKWSKSTLHTGVILYRLEDYPFFASNIWNSNTKYAFGSIEYDSLDESKKAVYDSIMAKYKQMVDGTLNFEGLFRVSGYAANHKSWSHLTMNCYYWIDGEHLPMSSPYNTYGLRYNKLLYLGQGDVEKIAVKLIKRHLNRFKREYNGN